MPTAKKIFKSSSVDNINLLIDNYWDRKRRELMPVQSLIPGKNRNVILPVPYYVQPTPTTCQSSVLKMMATYFDNEGVKNSSSSKWLRIEEIKQTINNDPRRPVKGHNAHGNMKWWLEKH